MFFLHKSNKIQMIHITRQLVWIEGGVNHLMQNTFLVKTSLKGTYLSDVGCDICTASPALEMVSPRNHEEMESQNEQLQGKAHKGAPYPE